MPPVSRHFADDFGITALASLFHRDVRWRDSPLEHVDDFVIPEPSEDAVATMAAIRTDAARLADSPLADAELKALWEGVAHMGLGDGATVGRGWFADVVDHCDAWFARFGVPVPGPVPEPDHSALVERVDAEIGTLGPARFSTRSHGDVGEDFRAALLKCCHLVSPELAFRFVVRVIVHHCLGVSPEQYRRFLDLADEFGHGEFLATGTKFLVGR